MLTISDLPAVRGWLEPGAMCFLAGPGGAGKSMLCADIAARVSTGRLPGLAGPKDVLWLAEDFQEIETSPRLDAAGADTRLVHYVSADGAKDIRLFRPGRLPLLAELLGSLDAGLIVADPVTDVMPTRQEARAARQAAAERGLIVLGTGYPSKTAGTVLHAGLADAVAYVRRDKTSGGLALDVGGQTRRFGIESCVIPGDDELIDTAAIRWT